MKSIHTQLKVFGIIVVIIGLALVFFGLNAKKKNDELRAQGVSLTGQVTGAYVDKNSKGKKTYVYTVQWGPPEARQSRKFAAKKDDYELRVSPQNRILNAAVGMRQIPGKPDTALIEGQTYAFTGWDWAGYPLTVIGAVMCVFGFKRKAAARI